MKLLHFTIPTILAASISQTHAVKAPDFPIQVVSGKTQDYVAQISAGEYNGTVHVGQDLWGKVVKNPAPDYRLPYLPGHSSSFNEDLRGKVQSVQNTVTGGKGRWVGGTWYFQNTPVDTPNQVMPYIGLPPTSNNKLDNLLGKARFGVGVVIPLN